MCTNKGDLGCGAAVCTTSMGEPLSRVPIWCLTGGCACLRGVGVEAVRVSWMIKLCGGMSIRKGVGCGTVTRWRISLPGSTTSCVALVEAGLSSVRVEAVIGVLSAVLSFLSVFVVRLPRHTGW